MPFQKFRLLLIVILSTGLAACHKHNPDNPVKYAAVLVNHTHVKMNVVIYKSFTDYARNRNAYITTSIDSVSDITLNNMLATGNYYYMDCYTDDYMYTNWIEQNPAPFVIYISNPDTTINLSNGFYQTNKRVIYLDGGDSLASKWKAIDAIRYTGPLYTIGTSVWSQLSAYQQYKEITVTKAFSAGLYYLNGNGDTLSETYRLTPDDTNGIGFGLVQPTNDSIHFISTGKQYGNISNYYGQAVYNSADTVIGHFNGTDSGYLFIMTREKI